MQETVGHSKKVIIANKHSLLKKTAIQLIVRLADQKGKYKTENNNMAVVKVITEQGIYHASGDLTEGIEIKL